MPSVLPESRRMHSVDGRDYSFRNCLGRGVAGGWEQEERWDAGPWLMRLQVSPAPVTKASPEAEAAWGRWWLPPELRRVRRTAIVTTTVGLPYHQACSRGRKKSKD